MTVANCNEARAEIIEESRRWVNENQGMCLKKGIGYYGSPRISSEIMDCSMPMTFDHLSYCSLGCLYCFAYFFKSNNPAITNRDLKVVDIPDLISGIENRPKTARAKLMHKHFYSRKFLLHWGGMADPFCYFEDQNRAGLPLIEALGENNYPTLFSFKGATIFHRRYQRVFGKYAAQRNFAFQISIITGDDKLAHDIEIGVPSPTKRLEAAKMLSDMGYWTVLRLRPYTIGVSDRGIEDFLGRALEAGIKGVSMEFFALDARANVGMRTRYNWIAKLIGVKNLMAYFSALSPTERGGYMRLNRLVKETHVRRVYEFCAKNGLVFGCSDPDYKELNTSGSCCAMPDAYAPNPGMTNWTRSQLTYHLKEARRAFHQDGRTVDLTFDGVYGDESYLDDVDLTNDHVAVTGMCNSARYAHTYRSIIRDHWNNLRSPANPRNYFHGKLLPVGLDAADNLIFRYAPMEYEDRWRAAGLDLTR